MRTLVAVAAAVLCLAAAPAPNRDDSINGSFNAWALEGLKLARERWRPDACLGSAIVKVRPGRQDPIEGHVAAGELYEFYFYAPSEPTETAFHYRAPFQPSESGFIPSVDRAPEMGPGPIANALRCIADMPITIRRAVEIAREAGFSTSADTAYEIQRNKFESRHYGLISKAAKLMQNYAAASVLTSETAKKSPHDRELWVFTWEGEKPEILAIDAIKGKVLKHVKGDPSPAVDARK